MCFLIEEGLRIWIVFGMLDGSRPLMAGLTSVKRKLLSFLLSGYYNYTAGDGRD